MAPEDVAQRVGVEPEQDQRNQPGLEGSRRRQILICNATASWMACGAGSEESIAVEAGFASKRLAVDGE